MSVYMFFNESGLRFNLSQEDSKRLLREELLKSLPYHCETIKIFKNHDARGWINDGLTTRFVIAFEGKDYCIIGDEGLGNILNGFWQLKVENDIVLGGDEWFSLNFNLWRTYVGIKQEYEENERS